MMSRVIPEAPRWLAARGRDVEADAVVRKFERHQRIEAVNSPAPFTASDASAKGSASPPISYLRLLVVACAMKTAVNAGIYLFMQWLPTILLAMQVNLSKSLRSEEHTSELQSLMRISYAVFGLKKKHKSEIHQHIRP